MKGITPSGAFGFYAGICFAGWLFVIFCFPEVKGMPLEAIREVFEHGFGVRYARKWQKENKEFAKINAGNSQAFGHWLGVLRYGCDGADHKIPFM